MEKIRFYYSRPMYTVSVVSLSNHRGEFNPEKIVGFSKSSMKEVPRITVCAILDLDLWQMSFGVARCNECDNFCRKTGREIALKNARENPVLIEIPPTKNVGLWRMQICKQIEDSINKVSYDSDCF